MNKSKPSFLPDKPITSMRPHAQKEAKVQLLRAKDQQNSQAQSSGTVLDPDRASFVNTVRPQKQQSRSFEVKEVSAGDGSVQQHQHQHYIQAVGATQNDQSHLNSSSVNDDASQLPPYSSYHQPLLPPRMQQGGQRRSTSDRQQQQQHLHRYPMAIVTMNEKDRPKFDVQQPFFPASLTSSPHSFSSVSLDQVSQSTASSFSTSTAPFSKPATSTVNLGGSYGGAQLAATSSPFRPPLLTNQSLPHFPSSTGEFALPLMRAKASTSSWVTSSPSTSLASAAQLAHLGVGIGPGVNPNVSAIGSSTEADAQNNPPIVNTGNNGPMCVQPGDWVCSSCGFVNWRRRKVCMKCFPFADTNEMSHSIANGALLAAQIAAGLDPSQEAISSLAQPRRSKTDTPSSMSRSTAPFLPSNPSLPPRPDRRLAPEAALQSSRDYRMQTPPGQYPDGLEELMTKSLSLVDGSGPSAYPGLPYSHGYQATSAALAPAAMATHLARSPSMPILLPSNPSNGAGRSIWTGIPSNHITSQPLNVATSIGAGGGGGAAAAAPTAYRSYKPSTVFASDMDVQYTPSPLASSVVNDVWQDDDHGGLWQAPRSTASSTSTIRPQSKADDVNSHQDVNDDAPVSMSPQLCKSKAVIQPPPTSTTHSSASPSSSSSSSSTTEEQHRHLLKIPSIIRSITSS